MIQGLFAVTSTNPTGTTYASLVGLSAFSGTETLTQAPWSAPGVFRHLVVEVDVAPGGTASRVFTLRKNAAGTALTVTIGPSDTTARLIGVDVAVAAGDLLTLQHTSSGGTPAVASGVRWSLEFEGSVTDQSGYLGVCATGGATAPLRYTGVFNPAGLWATTTAGVSEVVACAGTLTRTDVGTSTNLTVGNGITVAIVLNGVRQDGTGGTVNTTCTLTGVIRQASASYSLPLVAGDVVYVEATRVGTLGTRAYAVGTAFTATTAGQSHLCGSAVSASAVGAAYLPAMANAAAGTVETTFDARALGGVTPIRLSGLRVLFTAAPGSGKSRTTDLRRNATSPGPSVTVSDLATTGTDLVGTAVIVDGEVWNMRVLPSAGSPAGPPILWSCIQEATTVSTAVATAEPYVWGPV